ncbi:hypothetical protein GLAREA_03210 [Glarea lozoyensis ATCC 20868]|uniref:Uncharacterized protein n=1 Tax=Glarea lozoyensis (strain ATCC 20868 / MF5171) TaxID=1116229 RepID=S3CNM3_GLAL2|nr:uncharacterized protein GLAREA_03210 [Glarea lozoyensis ATCC 20868]EPE27295.1 hypothetical protein GLAREA_03210 [Glarea lozoyensis ATCC 20868]
MARTSDRLSHYLNDLDNDSRPFGVAPLRHYPVSKPLYSPRVPRSSFSSAGSPPPSEASTRSSASRSSYQSDASSRRSSASTTSSAPSIPPWQLPDLNQQLAMAVDYDRGYDLPCEHTFNGCRYRFHPEYHQEWIAHGISHFLNNPLPTKLICTICDVEFDSASHGDTRSNYEARMHHIGQHFYENRTLDPNARPATHTRPDYFLLEHLNRTGIIDDAHYYALVNPSERPACEGLQRNGFVTPEQRERREREERQSHRPHNQAREDRHRRKEGKPKSGKGKSTYPAEKSRHYDTYVYR